VFSTNSQEAMVSKLMEELKVPEERVSEVTQKIIAYINMWMNPTSVWIYLFLVPLCTLVQSKTRCFTATP
jgi:hypothetical protein